MLKNHPEICLFQPEIPQNTGNIGRLASATQCRLHIITPLGFSMDDKNLKRPGLDYWPYLDLEVHNSFDQLVNRFDPANIAFLSAKGTKSYTKIPQTTSLLVFGSETKGLPKTIWDQYPNSFYSIPIFHSEVRCLNLANAVAIVVYQQISLIDFLES